MTQRRRDATEARSRSHPRRATGRRAVTLRVAHSPRIGRYLQGVVTQTYFVRFVVLLVVLWLLFAAGVFWFERAAVATPIESYGKALYWGIAAFSTIFFGIIIATVTSYFMRPMQSPVHQIIDTIEYNLEHLEDLSVEELELLKKTTDALIVHTERLKRNESGGGE
jgi:voltage-gated potassium channel